MAELIVTTDELKEHLGLDGIEIENSILVRCLLAAIEYCEVYNETVYTKENLNPTVRIVILMLAAHYFNNREATSEKPSHDISFGVKSLLDIARDNFTC